MSSSDTQMHRPSFLLTTVLLILTGCASTGTLQEAEVQKNYDSIEGITYWTHTPVLLENFGLTSGVAVDMQTAAGCQGKVSAPCDDPKWLLVFVVGGRGLLGEREKNLTLRLGDRRIRPETANYEIESSALTGNKEEIAYQLTTEDVKDLAQLPKGEVEGRLAENINLDLSYERRTAVRMLYSRMTDE
jgi:hypothetical protein